jgi:hypothetical protein
VEDANGKKRTAIIVGVAIAGVGLFAIGFFVTRKCKRRREFKVMKVKSALVLLSPVYLHYAMLISIVYRHYGVLTSMVYSHYK